LFLVSFRIISSIALDELHLQLCSSTGEERPHEAALRHDARGVRVQTAASAQINTQKPKHQLKSHPLRARYTTVSHPESIDGWLAVQLGDKLWFPCWDSRVVADTAARIIPIIAAQERASSNAPPATSASATPPPAASPPESSDGTRHVTQVTEQVVDSVTKASSVSPFPSC
jgi:hypothetical protein